MNKVTPELKAILGRRLLLADGKLDSFGTDVYKPASTPRGDRAGLTPRGDVKVRDRWARFRNERMLQKAEQLRRKLVTAGPDPAYVDERRAVLREIEGFLAESEGTPRSGAENAPVSSVLAEEADALPADGARAEAVALPGKGVGCCDEDVARLLEEVERLRSQNESLSVELGLGRPRDKLGPLVDDERARLVNEVDRLRQQCDTLAEDLKRERRSREDEDSARVAYVSDLLARTAKVQEERTALAEEAGSLRRNGDMLAAEVGELRRAKTESSSLEGRMDDCRAENEKLQQERNTFCEDVKKLREQNKAIASELEELRREHLQKQSCVDESLEQNSRLQQERNTFCEDVKKLREQNKDLASELEELRREHLQKQSCVAESLEQNSRLQQENQMLSEVVASLQQQAAVVAAAMKATSESTAEDTEPAVPAPVNGAAAAPAAVVADAAALRPGPSQDCSACRLRTVMTNKETTAGDLRQAIRFVEVFVEEARRELATAEFRERRAAYEQLDRAMTGDDEELLANALQRAKDTMVDDEEIAKGENKLMELRSQTPEMRAAKLAHQVEVAKKKEAFLYVKQDKGPELQALLEGLHTSILWEDWKDHASRSLWVCSQQLRATRAQECLRNLLVIKGPGDKRPRRRTDSLGNVAVGSEASATASSGPAAAGAASAEITAAAGDSSSQSSSPSLGSAAGSGGDGSTEASFGSSGPPSPHKISLSSHKLGPPSAAGEDGRTPRTPLDTPRDPSLSRGTPNTAQKTSNAPAGKDTDGRLKAFRAVVQDDCDALMEALQDLQSEVWSAWTNKAGKTLITLSEERGSSRAYAVLARELGMLKEPPRETFEDRESVWVFEAGEVQPRRATVLEETSEELDEILVEFWDGDAPACRVERCQVRKMNG